MDHGSAVEKLESVGEIEASLLQDLLALLLVPFKVHDYGLAYVSTIAITFVPTRFRVGPCTVPNSGWPITALLGLGRLAAQSGSARGGLRSGDRRRQIPVDEASASG